MSGGEFGRCRNWMAIPHQKLYDDIRNGRGVAANEGAISTYEEIGALFAEVQDDIRRGISTIRAGYEGDGSDAAQNVISGLEAWTADAQTGSKLAGQNVQTQSDGYVNAKNSMPEPVTYSGWQTAGATVADVLIGGSVVREYMEAQQREAHMQAAQVMSGYDATAGSAALSMPTFVPPAPTTVQVAEPSAGQTAVGAPSGSVAQAGGFAGGGGVGGGGGVTPVSTFGGMAAGAGAGVAGRGGAGAGSPSRYSPGGGGVPAGSAPAAGTGPARSGPGSGSASGGSGTGRGGRGAGGAGAGDVPFVPGGDGYRRGAGGATGAGRYGGGAGGTLGRGFGPSGSGAGEGFGGRGAGSGGGGVGRGPGFGAGAAGMADDVPPGRGTGGAAAAGRGFGGGMAPFVGGAGRGRGGDDIEHQRPSYLVETDDIWGDGRKVAPPVIGEDPPR